MKLTVIDDFPPMRIFFVPDLGSEELIEQLRNLMAATSPFTMLTAGISSAYRQGTRAL